MNAAEEWKRRTYIRLTYLGDDRWSKYIADMGPVDNSHGEYTSDELMRVLRYFILEREGEVVIERCQSDEIDATREAVEAARDALPSSPDGLIRLSW